MKSENIFNPKKLEKLNNPARLEDIPPDHIWKVIDRAEAEVLVDVGAGTGLFTKVFVSLMKEGKAYACDLEPIMVEWIQANIVPSHPSISALEASADNIPLADNTADVLIMINLHHEIPEPHLAVKEANRILKSGGRIAIVDWKKESASQGPPVAIRVSSDIISGQLRDAGFSDVSIDNTLKNHSLVVGTA